MEYELIKGYMVERMGYTKEEAFEWLKGTGVRTFEKFFKGEGMAGWQRKEVRRLLGNLSLLEKLYEE